MSAKAVYSNKGLQVYITGEDFQLLLSKGWITPEVFIGKDKTVVGHLQVELSAVSQNSLYHALVLEQQAIDQARNEYSDAFAKRSQSIRKSNKE